MKISRIRVNTRQCLTNAGVNPINIYNKLSEMLSIITAQNVHSQFLNYHYRTSTLFFQLCFFIIMEIKQCD